MSNEKNNSLLETYKDKSNYLQRVMIIFLGVAFFFFFIVLIPYYSIRLDEHRISVLNDALDEAQGNISSLNEFLSQEMAKSASGVSNHLSDKLGPKLYDSILKQNNAADDNVSKYYTGLSNNKISNETLNRISYHSCANIGQFRDNQWITCNYLARIKELKEKIKIPLILDVTLNSTTVSRIKNTTELEDRLVADSKPFFLNVDDFVRNENKLKELEKQKLFKIPINNYYNLQHNLSQSSIFIPAVLTYSNLSSRQLHNITNQMETTMKGFQGRFVPFEAPVVGKIPLGFNEMIAVFPVALTIVFVFITAILRDLIRLRKNLEISQDDGVKDYMSTSSSWIDPRLPDYEKGQILHSIVAWLVLSAPVILFMASLILIKFVWHSLPVKFDKFPAFVAASDLNIFAYSIFYSVSMGIFIFCYIMIIIELKTNPSASPATTPPGTTPPGTFVV